MKLIDYGYPYWKGGKIKRQKTFKEKRIVLLSVKGVLDIREKGLRNLLSVDKDDNIIWIADLPTEIYDCYYDMKFENGIIYAYSSNSFMSEINPETGKIIKSYMIK